MERLVKKFEQRYRRALEHHNTWEDLQSRLLKQFFQCYSHSREITCTSNMMIKPQEVLLEAKNYGALESMTGIAQALPAMQVEQLEVNFRSMYFTLSEMERTAILFEKLWRDGCQLLKAEKTTPQQAEQRVGSRPSLNDCIKGLEDLYIMHRDEHRLKVAIISSLSYESRSEDVSALQAVLVDQPNLPPDEVKHIFEVIAAGDKW